MNTLTRIENLERELAALKEEVITDEKWSPSSGKYIIRSSGITCTASHWNTDSIQYGITFDDENTAQSAYNNYRFYHLLYKLALELNNGFPDNSESSVCYHIIIDSKSREMCYVVASTTSLGAILFKSEEAVQEAIRIIKRGDLN